jgi:serine/threonine-protein kinase RsbW
VERLRATGRTQTFLLDVSRVLSAATGYEETLRELARVALPTLGDLCLIDLIDEEGALRRMVAYHRDPQFEPAMQDLLGSYAPALGGPHPSARAIANATTLWSNEMSDEFLHATTRNDRHFALIKQLEFTSYIAVPLTVEEETLGALILVSTGSGRRFGEEDVELAETLADQVATVVRKARSYEREHDTSEILQSRLLPRDLPKVPGARLGVAYLPRMSGIEACGDFYDMVEGPEGTVWLMVGDVAGHDRQAAAQMGHLRVAARLLTGQVRQPGAIVRWLRRSWDRIEMDRLATAVFCKLDLRSGDLDIASAGHPAPVLVTQVGAAFLPVKPSPPLGGPRSRAYEWHGKLALNEALLLYSDGVLQDRDRRLSVDDAMEQLLSVVATCPPEPEELCRRVLAAMGSDRSDDVALLSIARSRS